MSLFVLIFTSIVAGVCEGLAHATHDNCCPERKTRLRQINVTYRFARQFACYIGEEI